MRISTKTSIALHLLILLDVFKEQKLTSELLAMSIGSNPVVVRNTLGRLKKAGIVDVQRGTGGAALVTAPEDISIWRVYQAVDTVSLDALVGVHPNPSPDCPVGSKINKLLEKPYLAISDAVQEAMSNYTLKQLLDEYEYLSSEETGG
ncbi:Rrf2 family transcriptional regulator [Candidatus Enterococcus murrayae]|uniref:Rrf2 family transcriptional regulator n=1 Tax=Candidatus Enterococcus murrayae TaxID=2815321 RepID=A0ABS3HLZ6_9ENTE|nr:Rrf2 family transcriptional regulator [Enterococcus sp. MJM16]MBO0454466.1 Rrf2 family transcriptional regulator [Enterococcus sp. MJM16]